MIKQYIKLFIRQLVKNKIYSFFSLTGLIIALTTCFIISIYADYEYSFDSFHKNNSKIYRVLMSDTLHGSNYAEICYPIVPLIKTIPEIKQSVLLSKTELLLKKNDQFIREEKVFYTEPSFFDVFSFKLIEGDPEFLSEHGTVFVSKSEAVKLFSNTDVIDKYIAVKDLSGEENTLIIKGVFEDFPENSHIKANMLMSFSNIERFYQNNTEFQWNNNSVYCYILSEVSAKNIEKKINNILPPEIEKKSNLRFNLQALNRIHLFSNKIDLNIEKQSVFKGYVLN